MLTERTIGRARLLSANTESPYFASLSHLLEYAFGPVSVIAEAFDRMPGVSEVLIIGSWAERYLGVPGAPPRDVDVVVVVVGEPPRRELRRLNEELEGRLGRPVQITVLSVTEWQMANSGFVREVHARPHLLVVTHQEE